jgi:hypothetical protein
MMGHWILKAFSASIEIDHMPFLLFCLCVVLLLLLLLFLAAMVFELRLQA